MDTKNNRQVRIRAYLSHPIRGKLGSKATQREIEQNRQRAIVVSTILRALFPELDLYVPAEHDKFVWWTYNKNYLTEQQILEIDCEILKECDLLIVYNWQNSLSDGMKKEIDCTAENNIPMFSFTFFDETVIKDLRHVIAEIAQCNTAG